MRTPTGPDVVEPPFEGAAEPGMALPVIVAQTLFEGRREVVLEHDGVRYRLRITRRNKLILQK